MCDNSNIWHFNKNDFNSIVSKSVEECLNQPEDISCGYGNSLIDNGGAYWINNSFFNSPDSFYYTYRWYPYAETVGDWFVGGIVTSSLSGVRPLIKLDSSVVVVSGTGTYNDPYVIENPNTIKDLSGHMNNGVLSEGGNWDKSTGTLKVNGTQYTGDYVDAGLVNYDFGSSASFVVRVKIHGITAEVENSLLGNWESGGGGILLSKSGKIVFGFYMEEFSSYKYFVADSIPTLEQWHTIVGVYDGTSLSVYMDGQSLTLDSDNDEYPTVLSSTASGNIKESLAPMMLGANPGADRSAGTGTFANATYSDALIFTRALTAEEIASDYSGVIIPSNTSDLLLRYDFNSEFYYDSGSSDGETGQVLSDVEVGSYIAYTGNNGCPDGHCDGTNANYVDDTDMGYCRSSGYKFTVNGWRVMAKDEGGVYIVSAGAPECMCTNSDGSLSNDSCSSSINSSDIDLHINNLNAQARKYCNELYAKDATCSASTAWAMASSDYQRVLGKTLEECYGISNNACGLNNTLIDNGGYYWYSTKESAEYTFLWYPNITRVNHDYSGNVFGVRPVLYLESGIEISGGSGTMSAPYQIEPYYEMEYVEGELGEVE